MLVEIVYMSRAQSPMSDRDLKALLVEARRNNERQGITGLLMYHHGSFLQLLEGEEQVITDVYDKIRRDPRHARVTQLYSHVLAERHFSDWSMGFVNVDNMDKDKLPGLSDILSSEFDVSALRQLKAASIDIMLYFKEQV